jgi:hypothetical protein
MRAGETGDRAWPDQLARSSSRCSAWIAGWGGAQVRSEAGAAALVGQQRAGPVAGGDWASTSRRYAVSR